MAMGVALYGSAEGCLLMGDDGSIHTPSTQAMSEEQLSAFMESVKADVGLQARLKAAEDSDAVVAIAKEAGFVITAEESARAQAEVSEDELEGVAGGIYTQADGCQPI